ncbi:MAG TPA: PAS domain-containing sensor histidine kinase, partial [Candidatus Omnitrophica bacterium]|nr:PAS domain-containing sensor histidine kinase [Candidatus Omnitrophota bacterium]
IILKNVDLLKDRDGNILGGIESFIDITEQKQATVELEESERRFKSLVFNIPGAVYRCSNDPDWKMQYISREIENLCGYSADDFIESRVRSFTSVIHPQDIDLVNNTIQKSVQKMAPYTIEYRLIHKDGYIKWVHEKGSGIFDRQNKLLWLNGVIIDITERKELDRLKDEFLSNVSHELRTPLSITKEGISLVMDGIPGEINSSQRDILKTAKDNVERLTKIINDLLDISKLDARKIKLEKTNFKIYDLTIKAYDMFKNMAEDKGLNFTLKDSSKESIVYADEARIMQVFTNLISNALKFTEQGKIEIAIQDREKELECSISDTGRGISKQDLPKVFNRFEQFGRTPGPGIKGTGLGLAISKSIIDMHGGRIWVVSEEGNGSRFIFTLPKLEKKQEGG